MSMIKGLHITAMIATLVITLPMVSHAASVSLNIQDSMNTDKFVVMDSGYVGVGNNAPQSAINVTGSKQAATQIRVSATEAGAGVNGGGGVFSSHNNGAALPIKNDRVGYLNAGAIDDVDLVSLRFGGGVQFNAADNWTIGRTTSPGNVIVHFPTYLRFQNADYNTANVPGGNGGSKLHMLIYPEGNVYIGTVTTPLTPPAVTQKLEVDGGIRLVTATAKPNCDANSAGTLWYEKGTTDDTLWVCAQKSSVYAWKQIW